MFRNTSMKSLLVLILIITTATTSFAQTDALEHNLWYNAEKTAKIQIYKAVDGKFYGKVAWLKVPEIDGKPKIDIHNPDKARRNDPILGLLLLKHFKKDGEHEYSDGTVYDPKNGKTYSCKMTLKKDKLDVRGYVGFSMLGRTTTWTKAE
ncbi:MAG: hypothetical protein JWQ38_38 [Flavipsychrobacter sp.]|nr:hypothetical protein [Flavipsychrobacter sp.]